MGNMRTFGAIALLCMAGFSNSCGDNKQRFAPSFSPDIIDLDIQPGVEPATTAQQNAAIVRPDRLMFPMDTMSEVLDWQPGRIVVAAPGENPAMGNPLGFARKVVSVQELDGMVVVETVTATIEEIFSGELQIRIDKGAVPVEPSMFDEESFAHLAEWLYPNREAVGFFPFGERLKHNAEEPDALTNLPGEQGWITDAASFVAGTAESGVQSATDAVGCCEIVNSAVENAGDFLEGRAMSLDSAAAAALVAITEGDLRAALSAGVHLMSAFAPPVPSIGEINGTFTPGSDGSPLEISFPKTKFLPFPAGFEFSKAITKRGNTVQVYVKGNGSVSAGFKMRPGFQFGLKIPVPGIATPPAGHLEMHAELDLDVDLELELEAGIQSVTLPGGQKLSKSSKEFKELVEKNAEAAKNIYAAEREGLLGDKDLTPPSSFTKTLLRSKPYVMTFNAGPVPVVITWSVTLDLVCGFEAKATLSGKMTWLETMEVRARLDASTGQLKPSIPELTSKSRATSMAFLGGGKANVACGLVPRVNAMLYDSIGMNLGVRGSLEAEVEAKSECTANNTQPDGKVTAGLFASLGVPLGGKVQIPGVAAELIKTPEFELWNQRFPLKTFEKTFPGRGLGYCTPTCKNGVKDDGEADVDCGGDCINGCGNGQTCEKNTDCSGVGVCTGGVCSGDTCADGSVSGDETDLDCGGGCSNCMAGKRCKKGEDCQSGFCRTEKDFQYGGCVASSCEDGVLSGEERGLDCGGGGCPGCSPGVLVTAISACASGYGVPAGKLFFCTADHCSTLRKDGSETGVDCGGSNVCPRCGVDKACLLEGDCQPGYGCQSGLCKHTGPDCFDRLRNGGELAVDCGAECAAGCPVMTRFCTEASDCASGHCSQAECAAEMRISVTGIPNGESARFGLVVDGSNVEDITTGSDGTLTFVTPVFGNRLYQIVNESSPTDYRCPVYSNGSGTITANSNVITATASCTLEFFPVSGTVTGLIGTLVLQMNGGETVTINGGTGYVFPTKIERHQPWSITVQSQPVGQVCTVFFPTSGEVLGPVTKAVACTSTPYSVGGTVSGIQSDSVDLRLDFPTPTYPSLTAVGNGPFTFGGPLVPFNEDYNVVITRQPTGHTCVPSNHSGTMGAGNVTNVGVACALNTYAVHVSVPGGLGEFVFQNNGGDNLTTSSNAVFSQQIAYGSAYNVTILSQPPGFSCSVQFGTGTMGTADVHAQVSCVDAGFPVGGTVSGLSGTVVLQNNGGDDLSLNSNGPFSFASLVDTSDPYNVTVLTQPAGQTCAVVNASGTVGSSAVTNVAVTCTTDTHTVGGSVSGLRAWTNPSMVLRNNNGDDLTVTANGAFIFATSVAFGGGYAVTVQTQPTGYNCLVASGTGTMGAANVTNVSVVCDPLDFVVGGNVTGLSGTMVLQNDSGDDLTITADGPFTFVTAMEYGDTYDVTVDSAPAGQTCTVTAGFGTVLSQVTNVTVTCGDGYPVGGTVTGLLPGTKINVYGDNFDTVEVGNGSFTLPTPYADSSSYTLTLDDNATWLVGWHTACTISNDTGTVSGGPVTNVLVACTSWHGVFMTSVGNVGGNLGGTAGADAYCQSVGLNDATRSWTWKAWVSDGSSSPATRFTQWGGEYRLMDWTTKVANNWADLTDGSVENPINLGRFAEPYAPQGPYTATTASGTYDGNGTCGDWSATSGTAFAGKNTGVDGTWTQDVAKSCGLSTAYIYCFQQ